MQASPASAHQATPAELRERLAVERRGISFLLYRNDAGAQRICELPVGGTRIIIGRSPECDVCLAWDTEVSRVHAELEYVGGQWVVVDDGLSRNGTWVGGDRLAGRHRLADGDVLRVGGTPIVFRHVREAGTGTTDLSDRRHQRVAVTPSQQKVLVALCRPLKNGAGHATPATNPQIAAELVLSVAAVKTHMRALFRAFELDDLAQQEKRGRLAALALSTGLVHDRDL